MKTLTDKQAQDTLPTDTLPQDLEETMYLPSIPGMRESLQSGMQASEAECASELPW